MISNEVIKQYQEEFNLSGQLGLLAHLHRTCSMTGRSILEIGGSNIPRPFILDILKAKQWISVDRVYPENRRLWPRQYADAKVIPVGPHVDYDQLGDFTILDGNVELLPP